MNSELLTTEELSKRIKYDPRTIRNQLKDAVLLEGVHYIRPFNRRKILYVWDAIQRELGLDTLGTAATIPLASGGFVRG